MSYMPAFIPSTLIVCVCLWQDKVYSLTGKGERAVEAIKAKEGATEAIKVATVAAQEVEEEIKADEKIEWKCQTCGADGPGKGNAKGKEDNMCTACRKKESQKQETPKGEKKRNVLGGGATVLEVSQNSNRSCAH